MPPDADQEAGRVTSPSDPHEEKRSPLGVDWSPAQVTFVGAIGKGGGGTEKTWRESMITQLPAPLCRLKVCCARLSTPFSFTTSVAGEQERYAW